MYYANDENGVRVNIDSATGECHYYCPVCKSRMIIKRGKIIAPHFAHKTKGQCDPWYTGKMSIGNCRTNFLRICRKLFCGTMIIRNIM